LEAEGAPIATDARPAAYFSRTVVFGLRCPCPVVTYRPLIALR
jgi:hypothetical protein